MQRTVSYLILGALCTRCITSPVLAESTALSEIVYPNLKITEVWFDWTDEWIEITNFWEDFSDVNLILSWAKNKPVFLTGISLLSWESIVLWDSVATMSWYIWQVLTGLWLSMSDSTGFTLELFFQDIENQLLDSAPFSLEQVSAMPNNATLSLYVTLQPEFSWQRIETTQEYTNDIFPDVLANPWLVYFAQPEEQSEEQVQLEQPIQLEEPTETDSIIEPEQWTGDQFTGQQLTGTDLPILIDDTTGAIDTTGVIQPIETGQSIEPEQLLLLEPQCSFSEIHSVVDTFPEYFEVYCESAFSGEIDFMGVWVGKSIKRASLAISSWWYAVFTSNPEAFPSLFSSIEANQKPINWQPTNQRPSNHQVIYLPWISLADAWESISLSGSFDTTASTLFPAMKKWQSYYPACYNAIVNYELFGAHSPGQEHICQLPIIELPIQPVLQQPAQQTQELPKPTTVKKPTTEKPTTNTKPIQKTPTKTTKKQSTPKTTAEKSTTTKKPATKTTAKKSTATKKTTTTQKAPTKASQVLQKEHDVYKNYIAFLHSYLKSHLYSQYDTLQLAQVQDMLKKSLQTAKKNTIMMTTSGGQSVSILDFQAQRKQRNSNEITQKTALWDLQDHIVSMGRKTILIWKKIHKYTPLITSTLQLDESIYS